MNIQKFQQCHTANMTLNAILHQLNMQDIEKEHQVEMFLREESHRVHVTVLYACKEAERKFRNMELSIN